MTGPNTSNTVHPRGATVVVKSSNGLQIERPTFELVDVARGKASRFDSASVRIGAGAGNDLVLDRPTVSAVHAEILTTAQGFRLKDLGSTNGTSVNGVRVVDAWIADGAQIVVGDVALQLRVGRDVVNQPLSANTELNGAVGTSAAMRAVFSRIERVAKTDATVLIHGETGTGKEVTAWAIYEASKRAKEPFVVVDCASIARTLIESELFGHEKGAFTGADKRRIGAFERAHGGTIFLDELGELELELQPKLLRVLERREIQRLGGDKPIPVDVRVIAATNRDLRAMVARREFREDLYYRLAVVTLELTPLRERKDDIPLLVDHFLKGLALDRSALPDGAMERFVEHIWPGNARELKNAVERAVVLGEAKVIASPSALSSSSTSSSSSGAVAVAEGDEGRFVVNAEQPYKDQKAAVIADFEERYVRQLVRLHKGNVSAAARVAGIDRMSLHKIIERYGLDARELGSS
ncbi:MAG TPA: sigma 54-interacting transcriptional regulator [Myxococcota bacterium]